MANLLLAKINFKDALKTAGISEYQVTSSVQRDQVVGGAVHFHNVSIPGGPQGL